MSGVQLLCFSPCPPQEAVPLLPFVGRAKLQVWQTSLRGANGQCRRKLGPQQVLSLSLGKITRHTHSLPHDLDYAAAEHWRYHPAALLAEDALNNCIVDNTLAIGAAHETEISSEVLPISYLDHQSLHPLILLQRVLHCIPGRLSQHLRLVLCAPGQRSIEQQSHFLQRQCLTSARTKQNSTANIMSQSVGFCDLSNRLFRLRPAHRALRGPRPHRGRRIHGFEAAGPFA